MCGKMIILQMILCVLLVFELPFSMGKVCDSTDCKIVSCFNGSYTMFGDWDCTYIYIVNFKSNNIMVSELSKLTRYKIGIVDLTENNIFELPYFVFTGAKIDRIYLKKNYISKIDFLTFRGMSPLKELSLQHNWIKQIDQQSIPQAEDVSLSYNLLETIHANMFVNISYVRILDLAHNNIKRIDKSSFKGLIGSTLDLSFNKLEYLGAKSIPIVKILSLERNQILTINKNAFVNITKLKHINVKFNCIQQLYPPFNDISVQFDNCSSILNKTKQKIEKPVIESLDNNKIIDNQSNETEDFPMELNESLLEIDDSISKIIIYIEIIGILVLIISIQTVLIIWYRWRTNSIPNSVTTNYNERAYRETTNEYEEINDLAIELDSFGYMIPRSAL